MKKLFLLILFTLCLAGCEYKYYSGTIESVYDSGEGGKKIQIITDQDGRHAFDTNQKLDNEFI